MFYKSHKIAINKLVKYQLMRTVSLYDFYHILCDLDKNPMISSSMMRIFINMISCHLPQGPGGDQVPGYTGYTGHTGHLGLVTTGLHW